MPRRGDFLSKYAGKTNFRFFGCEVRVLGLLLATLLGAFPIPSQSTDTGRQIPPDATQIVSHLVQSNQNRAALLQHYEGCRRYSLDYTGFPSAKSAEMVVDARFSAPAEKQFRIVREDGSKLLLNRVLKGLLDGEKEALAEENRNRTALTPENYEFRLAGADAIEGRPQYVLEVAPRSRNKFLYRGRIWVDATDFAVSRISAEPAKTPSVWISHIAIEHEYAKFGDFWLPVRNTSITKVRLGGTAKLRIDYLNYSFGQSNTAPDADVCRAASGEAQLPAGP